MVTNRAVHLLMLMGDYLDMNKTCVSCGARISKDSSLIYPCPVCGEMLARCKKCKKMSNPYRCECGFEGP